MNMQKEPKEIERIRFFIISGAVCILVLTVSIILLINNNSRSEKPDYTDLTEYDTETLNTPSTTETIEDEDSSTNDETLADTEIMTFEDKLESFARTHGLNISEWPEELIESASKHPQIEDCVLNYPLKKDVTNSFCLDDCINRNSVPLLLQWDERWGYNEYAGGVMGLTGCGPTCLSMVCLYLLNDPKYSPEYVAEFSTTHGYSVNGNGSKWILISEGGKKLGLDVREKPLVKSIIFNNLSMGNPIICVMKPGDFTETGHFIVMTGVSEGKIKVNDPFSLERSSMLWDYDRIKGQIGNLWVCKLPDNK